MLTLPATQRLFARAIGSAGAIGWSAWLVAGGMDYSTMALLWASVATGVFVMVNVVAVGILFADERAGGELLLICGSLFGATSYTLASDAPMMAAAVSGGPFVVAGACALAAAIPRPRIAH